MSTRWSWKDEMHTGEAQGTAVGLGDGLGKTVTVIGMLRRFTHGLLETDIKTVHLVNMGFMFEIHTDRVGPVLLVGLTAFLEPPWLRQSLKAFLRIRVYTVSRPFL